ncbi:MAG: hypothetical protein CVU04_05400, partial [Bacteroidetes bacterium HGW-Bacteroidetes-20]
MKKEKPKQSNTLDKDSESRLNLLMTFQEFKELKSIDRESMMKILEDVMHAALGKKFGAEAMFSVVVNVDNAPKIFLMYRSIMLFFGGIGLILVVTSILPDIYSMRLYTAEGHTDLMMPNLANSVRTVILIYVGYATAGT